MAHVKEMTLNCSLLQGPEAYTLITSVLSSEMNIQSNVDYLDMFEDLTKVRIMVNVNINKVACTFAY